MALYLGNRQQQLLSMGLTVSGLAAMVGGGALAWANPQLYNPAVYEDAWVSGRLQSQLQYQAPTDRRGQALGQALMAFGFVLGGSGLYLASGDPATLRPEELPSDPANALAGLKGLGAKGSPGELIPEDAVIAALKGKIMHLVGANEWLKQCLMAPTVVLVGDSGSGKSTIANAIAVLRFILWRWPVSIFDPHAKENMQFGTWLVGHLYGLGGDPEGSIREGLMQAMKPFEPFAQDNKTRHTLICDEFTGWSDGSYPGLAPIAAPALSHANRSTRKQGHGMIVLLHGDKKGTAGGEDMGSGILEAVLRFAAVIKVDGKTDEWGNPCWAGTGRFKPPGKPYTDGELNPIVVPELISPGRLKREIGELLEYLGIGIEDDQKAPAPVVSPQVQQAVEAAFNPDTWQAIAKRLYEGPVAEDVPDIEALPNWDDIRPVAELRSLLVFCRQKGWRTVDVGRLKGSWGKSNGITSREAIRNLVQAAIAANVAVWSAKNQNGEGSEFQILPGWQSWPTWLE